MIRQALLVLAVVAVAAAGACSRGEAPRTAPLPEPVTPPPAAPIAVRVAVPEEPGPGIEAWARELEAAITAGHGQLALAETEGEALVVLRINAVETGVDVIPEPPGEGEIVVMRGALLVGGSAREFNLIYRGATRPQAEALARHLRRVAAEGGPAAPTETSRRAPS